MRAGGFKVAGEIKDVAHCRRAEGINGLGVIADHGETVSFGFERQKDRGLEPVRVLILVDKYVVEARRNIVRDLFHLHHLRPLSVAR